MRNRPRLVASLVAGAAALVLAACSDTDAGVDVRRSEDGATAATNEPSGTGTEPDVPAGDGGVAPFDPSELTGADDLAATLTSLGFPEGWPVPDGDAELVGLAVRRTVGDDGVGLDLMTAYRVPAAPLDELAREWAAVVESTFDTGEPVGFGSSVNGELESQRVALGLDEDTAPGEFEVSAIGRSGDTTSPIDVRITNERPDEDGTSTFAFPDDLAAALPSIEGCDAQLTIVSLDAFDAPDEDAQPPAYQFVFDGTCPADAFDRFAEWASTQDRSSVTDDSFSADGSGPDGYELFGNGGVRDDGRTFVRIEATRPL